MTKYIGSGVVVEFGTVDISGTYTAVDWSDESPEGAEIDVSDKSTVTTVEVIEGLAGRPKTTVNLSASDVVGGATAITGLTEGTSGTLTIYPEGKVQAKPKFTLSGAKLRTRAFTSGYQAKAEWKLTFSAFAAMAFGTYSTA